jgi:pyridoxal phosphate phosphatase PHOSPHO2
MYIGTELKNLKEKNGYNKIIYTGDGQNDFCPMLQLRR